MMEAAIIVLRMFRLERYDVEPFHIHDDNNLIYGLLTEDGSAHPPVSINGWMGMRHSA